MSRLLRIEARCSVLLPMLPLMAMLLAASPIARYLTPVALWSDRSTDLQSVVQAIGPFTAGATAWRSCPTSSAPSPAWPPTE
jgi:hypothetical protein